MRALLAWWARQRRHDPWWAHTDGDYIDLRPRLEIGRRRLW